MTDEVITSTQNAGIKNLAKLKLKKDRDLSGQFLVEGLHMIEEASKAGLLQKIYALQGEEFDQPLPMEPIYCTQPVLNKLSSQKSDAKIIGVCVQFPVSEEINDPELKKYLVLEHIQDPGNLGTLIRSAYAFGADAIVLSKDCADIFSPKVLQSTQGAVFHLPVFQLEIDKAIEQLKRYLVPVYAAALHRDSIKLQDLHNLESFAVIIGNEGKGISENVLALADHSLYIEMQDFESLNAAVAGSIILYHLQF